MSSTIENRIVEMQFNNKQFEKNVATSMSTIEKLKQSLNFSGVASSFEDITSSSKKVDMSSLSSAVESVKVKFSAFEVVAITALTNLTNSAIEAGKELVSSLSVDNISDGWEKFANKTSSVATLVAQGYDLDVVTEQLERLNWYTDETSYNFTDMVSNIAKFTASGQDLETSVTAMEGIANWAALSGQNATTASNAMYQLSQAMSAGYMRLEDYKSIQNASMDTEEFREKCIAAAVALGTLQDNGDGTYTSIVDGATSATFTVSQFTTGLTEGAWLTSDVMMDVFNAYSGAVDDIYEYSEEKGITASEAIEELGDSVDEFGLKAFKAAQEARTWSDVVDSVKDAVSTGWMNTFEIIFGNYEEATELWTDLANAMYDVFAAGAEDRNEMLTTWKELGGRTVLVDAFWTAWDNIGEVLGTVKEAFKEVFPSVTAEQLYSMTEGLQSLAEKFKMSDENLANLKSTFKGLFSVLDIVKQALTAVFNGVKTLLGGVSSLASSILGVTGSIGDWLTALDESVKESEVFEKAVTKIVTAIQTAILTVKTKIKSFTDAIQENIDISEVISKLSSSLSEFVALVKKKFATPGFELLKSALETICNVVSNAISSIFSLKDAVSESFDEMDKKASNSTLVNILGAIWTAITTIASAVKNVLSIAISGLVSAIGNADIESFFDIFNTVLTSGVIASVVELIHNLAGGIGDASDFIKDLKENMTGILENLGSALEAWSTNIKADTILKIAGAVGILTIALIALSGVDADALSTSIAAITGLMVDLVAAMTALQKLNGFSADGIQSSVTGLLDSFTNAKQYSNMIKFAAAIGILAVALALLTAMDQSKMATSFAAITGLITDLTVAMIALNKLGGKTSGAMTMLALAASILILTSAVETLSGLKWDEIGKGLTAVGGLCAELVVSMIALNKLGGSTKGAVMMLALAEAINILGSACETFSAMSWEEIAKGLVSVGALLTELVAFTKLTGNANKLVSTGLAMIEIGAAMKIFASAVEDFGALSWTEIAKGLVAMAGALTEITVAVNLMPKNMVSLATGMVVMGAALEIIADVLSTMGGFTWEEIAKGLVTMGGALAEMAVALNLMKGTASGSAALLVAAAAIDILTPALKSLGDMTIAEIAKSLITLAGAFTVIGVAAAVLSPLTTSILALSGAFALIGVGVAAVGVGLVAAGAGLTSIAAGVTALAASLAVSLTSIVTGIETIVLSLASLIPDIMVALGEGIVQICQVIADGAPVIAEAVKAVVLSLIDVLVECVPALVTGALELLLGVVDGLVEYAPQIVSSLLQMIVGIIEAIADNIPDLVLAVMDVIGALFSAIIEAINGLDSQALVDGIVCVGLLSALVVALAAVSALVPAAMVALGEMALLVAEMAAVFAAIGALSQIPGLTWLIDEGADLLESLGNAIGSFIGGIVGGFLGGVTSEFPKIGTDLAGFMNNAQPFIDGAAKIDSSVMNGVKALAETIIVLTAADIINGLTSWFTGGSSLADFGEELAEFGPSFSSYYESVKGIDGTVVQASANAALALAEMAEKLPKNGGVVGWFTGESSLSVFAEELADFGPSLKDYADSVDGLDSDVVVNSANAALALAEMAQKLPDSGGVVGWFTGDSSLSVFAEELAAFGPSLKEYGDSVSGLDSGIVIESANAASSLAELAKNLPDQGGVVNWFTGENTLSAFGAELAKFGPYLSDYASAVSDIDGDIVISSANAASSLAEMAKNLPDQGGVVNWFTGENTLSAFGAELVKFGPQLVEYAKSVNGLDSEVVNNSAASAQVLFKMAENLPDQGGIVGWFTGETTLSKFGEELVKFGPNLKEYSDSVKDVKNTVVTASANAASVLFQMAENLPEQGGILSWFTGETTLSKFGKELVSFGPNLKEYSDSVKGVDSFVVTVSAYAAQVLFKMAENLPDQGGILDWFTGDNSLTKFGKELVSFGPNLKTYSDSVKGVDAGVVAISAYAGQVLFKMAENLPEQGGILSWFTGDTSLAKFGEELVAFGPSLKTYSDSVKGVDAGVVTISSYAAQILFKMSESLPEQGGILSWFTGDTSLSKFGAELVEFGPYLAEYAESVDGINSTVVKQSANAAKALLEMSQNLPDQGGVLTWFTGDNTLSVFGEELVEFGPYLAEYAESVKNVKSSVVTSSANAAKAVAELANNLPDSGGIISWFTGDNDIESFGKKLSSFGDSFKEYYNSVKNIKTSTLSKVTEEFGKLVDLAADISDVDLDGMSNFSKTLTNLGETGIDGFIDAFKDSTSEVKNTAKDMLTTFADGADSKKDKLTKTFTDIVKAVLKAMSNKESDFKDEGQTVIVKFKDGIENKKSTAKTKMTDIMTACLNAISAKYSEFNSKGKTSAEKFISGITSKKTSAKSAFTTIASEMITAVKDYQSKFYSAGSYLVDGFANGISDNAYKAEYKARLMAQAAAEGAQEELDEHSPSKVGYKIGDYFGIGFVNAIDDSTSGVYEAAVSMADSAIVGLSDAASEIASVIDDNVELEPTIRPVIDFSDVEAGAGLLDAMFSRAQAMSVGDAINQSTAARIQNDENILSVLSDNEDVVDAINSLKDDLASLANVVGNLKVVMDTGALVGTLASPMNSALGRQSIYERRGI